MRSGTIELGDGRSLGYHEFGATTGPVVVNCHGGLVCGLDAAPFADVAAELGVRIISPDRPGLGSSDPMPGRTTGNWAADVGSLLDACKIDTASVLGWSMGGQYALACAAKLPDRVTQVVVVAGAPPLDDDATFAKLNPMDRRLTRLSQHHPVAAREVFATLGEAARHAPHAFVHLTARGAVPEEKSTLEALPDPGIAAAAAVALERGEAWSRSTGPGSARGDSPSTT